ncbi:NAD-dependent epimerase/dehydratase family protein [Aliarcobacter butzleri]|uniref:NAD(P)-dependent oxidoreductase n=1 Tax=Aliarcobacter butzleri TaxID=28197 RepID=A0AAW7PNX0_9BACT|nr:NAD(P)-dependent oxidoreductase [Aliarcobacter butzleri]MDN5062713.1 NAD(P)-dependent oxidoreductase [Aliarcobacter butzleri]MDN5065596.1 NAD(P)-dependent oxidoreductase [Aliarcobacter butzleri]
MKILLTGSTGFLGTYIKNNIDNKYDILYGTTSNTNNKNYLKFDLLYRNIKKVLENETVNCIIHNAAIIPKNFDEATYELFLENTEMMKNLYEYAKKSHLNKFIYLSSFGSMNEPKLLDIGDYYTMSKIVGEHFCSMMSKQGINATSFRISAPFGEYSHVKNVLNIFIEKSLNNEDLIIHGTGSREQNFTYAGNILQAIELAINNNINGNYEIVGEKSISMLELAKIIIKLTSSKSKIIFNGLEDAQENYRPTYSFKKAFDDFGYYPKYKIEEALEKYLKWYKNENSINI